jgi:hypothetical protein
MRSTNIRLAARAVAALALVAAQACGRAPAQPGQPGQPGRGGDPPGRSGGEAGLLDGPGYNGLPARSLLYNAITQNPKALKVLRDSALTSALFDAAKHPYMSRQLADDNARDVMADIVSCALDPSAQVTYRAPGAKADHVWRGELALCPSWATGKPSDDCLRLVSSCLFARTNRLHRRVPVRFGTPKLPGPRDRVAVAMMSRDATEGTAAGDTAEIQAAEYGWRPGFVGTCAPGQPFALAFRDPARCHDTAVRVCQGIHGCQRGQTQMLAEQRGACGDSPVTFSCPADGFFGAMTEPGRVPLARRSGDGKYPATEQQVFPFLEGAFFGNLFDPDGLTRAREIVIEGGKAKLSQTALSDPDDDDDTVANRHIYACYSQANDDQGVAYLNQRICAKPGSKKCFPNPPRRCHFKDVELNRKKGYHCAWRSDDGLYRGCIGDDGETYPAMTVFLHEPCGLSDAGCAGALPTEPTD